MAYNKITLNGETKIDLTQDTVTAEDVALGKIFHLNSGEQAVGTLEITSGGGSEEVIVERYTDVTALKNKALEVVGDNRYCCLKITNKKDKTVSTTAYKVTSTGFVTENIGMNVAGTACSKYLAPIYDNANLLYVVFSNGQQTCTLNANPSYKVINNYGNANGIVFSEGSETLATLISGGYITVDLCYI
jgi:hypothetical protein